MSLVHSVRRSVRRFALGCVCAAMLVGGTVIASPAAAQGDLLVAPTRIVIANGGGAEVVLSNIGSEPATYRIALELRRMSADGDIEDVAEAEASAVERESLAMIRYAPRRITLLPGQPQSVRISARPPEGLADGEYRVHMSFRAVPPALPADAPSDQAATGVSIRLVPVYGITIPIIVRKGRLDVTATLANPKLVAGPHGTYLELDMTRTGQRSTYGELIGRTGKGEVVFNLKGLAIYPEVSGRKARVPLTREQVAQISGPVTIEYRELPENGGQLIAKVTSEIH